MIRLIGIDVDGTLLDSNDAHARAWVEAFVEHGIAAPRRDFPREIPSTHPPVPTRA